MCFRFPSRQDSAVNAQRLDIERTYEPHTFERVPWIENWFLGQVFSSHITDFGSETRHFKTGVAKDNPIPVVPDTILAKLVAMFEAKLRRNKVVALIPLVPRKPSVDMIKKTSTNKLKKRPSALILGSNRSQHSLSRPGTRNSQNSDTQTQRQPNKLRKRSRSFTRSSPGSVQQSLPVCVPVQTPPSPGQAQTITVRDRDRDKSSEVVHHRPITRINWGPPPSPSHGTRFKGMGVPRRRSPEKIMTRPSRVIPSPTPPERGRLSPRGWEII